MHSGGTDPRIPFAGPAVHDSQGRSVRRVTNTIKRCMTVCAAVVTAIVGVVATAPAVGARVP